VIGRASPPGVQVGVPKSSLPRARGPLARLGPRLTAAFVVVALFAAGLTALIGLDAATGHFERFIAQSAPVEDVQPGAGQRLGRGNRLGQQVLLEELRRSQLQAGLVALLVAGLAGAVLAYSISRPVRELTDVTRRYTGGDRAARSGIAGGGELAELGSAFNALADNLNAEQERERQMMADIVHEFRTPLTVLRSELEAMQDGMADLTPQALGPLIEETELLSRLVTDLRILSLAETGQLHLDVREVDVAELAASVVQALGPLSASNNVAVVHDAESARVSGDPERLRQVLLNLTGNALRHTPSGGRVEVKVRGGERCSIEVRDDGPGIPPESLERVFDRFYRVDRARSRSDGGSGIGLAIVRAIVQAHGGSVSAANAPGGGAVFTVLLPILSARGLPGAAA
jgi:two-component system sensor histidine kinase BaeS